MLKLRRNRLCSVVWNNRTVDYSRSRNLCGFRRASVVNDEVLIYAPDGTYVYGLGDGEFDEVGSV